MAKAPATPKPDVVAEAAPVAPARSKKLLIIAVAVVVVVMLLLVSVAGLLMLKKGKSADAEHADEVEASEPFDLSKPPTFVALEPFVVNLAPEDGERYLQVVLALRVADPKTGEMLGGFMPEIRHQINLLLAGKLPSELATPAGRETLANEIVERANGVLGGKRAKGANANAPAGPIQAVLFNSFIIQ